MEQIVKKVFEESFDRMVISNGKYNKYNKVIVRPVIIKDVQVFQFEMFTNTQAFHRNLELNESIELTVEIMLSMKQIDVFTSEGTRIIKRSKKGKIMEHMNRKNVSLKNNMQNNRQKQYILDENIVIPAFVDLGIMSNDGKIIKAKYDKYKQINRFIEMIDDVISKENVTSLNIIDFGCGKSYLTFILYHYLTNIKKIEVQMVGLDLKQDVIKKCNDIKDRYGYENIKFEVGDIHGYTPEFEVDMVISLHACDVATDFALANAISWNTKYIFAVPCCQKEVNQSINNTSDLMLSYGIIKERYSSLITDTIRGKVLELCGYNVQLLEFVDLEHSPKNILIRGIQQEVCENVKLSDELKHWCTQLSIKPTLVNELSKMGIICKE